MIWNNCHAGACAPTAIRQLAGSVAYRSGMTRLGFDADQIDWLIGNKSALDGLDCRYLMSHLVSAEVADDPANALQLAAFNEWRRVFPACGKSRQQRRQYVIARLSFSDDTPGIALYGVDPADQPTDKLIALLPGNHASFNCGRPKPVIASVMAAPICCTVPRALPRLALVMPTAIIANWRQASVLIGPQTAPVIGRVSMDSITVDVTDIDPAHLQHGFVELLHDGYDLSRMAGDAETIAYEI